MILMVGRQNYNLPEPQTKLRIEAGFAENSYNTASRNMQDSNLPWYHRVAFGVLATATLPLALAESLVAKPIVNIPAEASLSGQYAARASLQTDSQLKTLDYLKAISHGANAFSESVAIVVPFKPKLDELNTALKPKFKKVKIKEEIVSSPVIKQTTDTELIPKRGYHKETYASKPVKPEKAVDNWEEFLGEGPYTDIHPRTKKIDNSRLVSSDGQRSIRMGSHELNSKPTKFHYHEETWTHDINKNIMNVDNTVIRVPLKNKK